VLICSSLDRFAGCFLQIRPQPFSFPTQVCERSSDCADVGNKLRDIINSSIESMQFFLAEWACAIHYGPDLPSCRLDAIIVYHMTYDIEFCGKEKTFPWVGMIPGVLQLTAGIRYALNMPFTGLSEDKNIGNVRAYVLA